MFSLCVMLAYGLLLRLLVWTSQVALALLPLMVNTVYKPWASLTIADMTDEEVAAYRQQHKVLNE